MNNIETLYNEWRGLLPRMTEPNQNRLDQKFMLEFNYNSNHIEGNTLTYGQTEMLLMFGKVVEDADMKDLEEMKASNVGLKIVKEAALDKEQPLSEYFIRSLHQTLLREDYTVYRQLPDGNTTSYVVHAGQYKTRPNSVITPTGERFEYATPEESPALMKDLIEWYNEEEKNGTMSPIELASLFHYRYIRIHPFEDGNGRISRLIVNYILYRHGYPMIVVKTKDKKNYLTALNRCDIVVGAVPSDGAHAELSQITPFVNFMSKCLERALTICIKGAKGESIDDVDDWRKKLTLKYSNKIGKPEGTDEQKNIIIGRDFKELLQFVDKELSVFYSIFTSVVWDPKCPEFNVYDDKKYFYSFIHFSTIQQSCHILIRLTIQQFLYKIEVSDDDNEPRRYVLNKILWAKEFSYSEILSEQDKIDVVNAIGNTLTLFLESGLKFQRENLNPGTRILHLPAVPVS